MFNIWMIYSYLKIGNIIGDPSTDWKYPIDERMMSTMSNLVLRGRFLISI